MYLLESPRWGDSNKYTKGMFSWRIKWEYQRKNTWSAYFCVDQNCRYNQFCCYNECRHNEGSLYLELLWLIKIGLRYVLWLKVFIYILFFRWLYICLTNCKYDVGKYEIKHVYYTYTCTVRCYNLINVCHNLCMCSQMLIFSKFIWTFIPVNIILRNIFSLPVNYRWLTHVVGGQIRKY